MNVQDVQKGKFIMQNPLIGNAFRAVRQSIGKVLRAGAVGLASGAAAVEALAAVFNTTSSNAVNVAGDFKVAAPTAFVHIVAIGGGLIIGYLSAFTVAISRVFGGIIFAAEHVDDAIGAIANQGLDVLDAAVDAVDGPNRHGFRGKRGSETASVLSAIPPAPNQQ